MPTPQDEKYSDSNLDPANFEREFANRAGSPGYGQAHAEMDEAEKKKADSPEEIKNAEESGAEGSRAGSAGESAAHWATKLAGPEAGAALTALTAMKSIFWSSKRRKRATIGASIAGTLAGGGLLALTFISGPLELVHLAHTLETAYKSSHHISDSRSNKLLRFSANDVGETRLGVLGRQYLRGTVSELSDIGIDFNTNSASHLNGIDINTEKLSKKFPELNNMSSDEKKSFLAEKLGTTADQIKLTGKDTFSLDLTDAPLKITSATLSSVVGSFADGGDLSTAMKARVFSKYFDLPSLFHPIKRAAAAASKKAVNTAEAKAQEEDAQVAEEGQVTDAVDPAALTEAKDLEDNSGALSDGLNKVLFFTGGLCTLRSDGQKIDDVNRALIVMPAVVMALRFISIGSQIESGKDFSASQLNGILASLVNKNGQSVFAGDALQALAGSTSFTADQTGKTAGSLDLPLGYKQAFLTGRESSGFKIKSYTDKALSFFPRGAGVACNTWVQDGTAAITFLAAIGQGAADALSGGTLTPAIVAEVAAIEAEKQLPGLAISAVATNFIDNYIVKSGTDGKLAKDIISGPIGGNILAYGAEYGGNLLAASEGGTKEAGSAAQLVGLNQQKDKQQFESQSFFARMFNIHDYRSLVGRLATSLSPSLRQNIFNFASDIGNFGNVIGNAFTNLFAAIFPHASAASTATYCWGIQNGSSCTGIDQVGIPDNILNSTDPTMANPYANANKVASILSASQKSGYSGTNYIQKANTCFGVTISNSGGQWDVVPSAPVDQTSESYINANCSDTSDKNWQRIMLFVADNSTMDTMACASGDATSCSTLGF